MANAQLSRSLDALLPVLYLRGISTGDFQDALTALLGADAPNLSPGAITRLTAGWQDDYDRWLRRDLSARRYVVRLANSDRWRSKAHLRRTGSICRRGWNRRPSACW